MSGLELHSHCNCIGLRLFQIGRLQIEVWICPANAYIPPHNHPNMKSKIVLLWGRLFGNRNGKSKYLTKLKFYTLKSTDTHSAYVGKKGAIFMNIEWLLDKSVTSASKAFNLVNT